MNEDNSPEAIDALIRGDGYKSQASMIDEFDSDDYSVNGVEAEDLDAITPSKFKKQFSTTVPPNAAATAADGNNAG